MRWFYLVKSCWMFHFLFTVKVSHIFSVNGRNKDPWSVLKCCFFVRVCPSPQRQVLVVGPSGGSINHS